MLKYERLNLIQGSEEWKRVRLDHITASHVPVIYGLSPYKTVSQYAQELILKREAPVQGKAYVFQRGHAMEAAAREWVRTHLQFEITPAVVRSYELPFLLASLDGLDERQRLVFEAKYVGRDVLAEVKQGRIKPEHEYQVYAQLLATGFDRAIYFAMDPSGDAAYLEIYRRDDILDEMSKKLHEFWERIKTGVFVSPDAPEIETKVVEDPQFSLLSTLHLRITELQTQYQELKTALLKKYEDSSRIQCGEVTITQAWRKGSVDWEALARSKNISESEIESYRKLGSRVAQFRFKTPTGSDKPNS